MGQFSFRKTDIDGLVVVEPKVFGDKRGYFIESFNSRDFEEAGIYADFVQDNESMSQKNVLRGLHFQKDFPQAKLIRAISGEIYDVAVDIRDGSSTFGMWHGEILSNENKKQLYIPEGFAHGFYVRSKTAIIAYKCTDYYHPEDEDGLLWSSLGIDWGNTEPPILSDKDTKYLSFRDYFRQ